MAIIESNNSVELGFKVIIVLLLIALVIAGLYSFSYDYPSLGWLSFGILGVIICVWLAIAGHGSLLVLGIGIACALTILFSFAGGVLKDWHRLTEQKVSQVFPSQVTDGIFHYIDD